MRKWFISFLLLISIFICYNKVGATTLDYDSGLSGFSSEELSTIKSVIDYIDGKNVDNIPYYLYSNGNHVIIKFLKNDTSLTPARSWVVLSNFQTNVSSGSINVGYTYKSSSSNDYYAYTNRSNMAKTIGINFTNVSTTYNNIDLFLDNPSYNIDEKNPSYYYVNSTSQVISDFRTSNYSLLYTSYPMLLSYYKSNQWDTFNSIKYIYNGEETTLNNGFFFEAPLNLYYADNEVVVNSVKSFGNNTFGFYQNVVDVTGATLDGPSDSVGVICEENKPFQNGYCSLDYNDLKNKNSDISVFNNYGMMFIQMFGKNSGYLYNNKYYLYSFRIQKPFVPSVANLFINTFNDNTVKTNILDVYLNDGGSYTDYVVKFKIENSDYDSSTNLKNIMVVFQNGLGSYYNNSIPSSFNYSVYRSFKLQYFDSEPTMSNVNDFYNNNDLSSIDGLSSQNSFFTDNEFNSFGFGGIITAPFRFLYALENYDSCSDITIPFPHSNQNLTLTCVRKNIPSSLNPLIFILQVILSGIITYRIAVGTLRIIKDVSSPDNANIEVVDL